ncbi:MAG TPA: methionine--tRNA ligase [candidate division WWE3 bacterium]|uniref:Methionine--tRNA ligase n=1 Tax=candidate division WWE3 bacterium TaxID=2053526 RepID=A0A7C1T7J1_UNCKA|nr:methionine--tRNA ligase [candidate division WWE3 bacterium]
MENSKFYITTAIPYVNAAPHIGFALEVVQADVLARYHRLVGDDTYFLTGTDENALKNVQAAEEAGEEVETFVDRNSKRFKDLKGALNLSFDDFIRTTEDRHIKGAQKFWNSCNPEDIYKKKYRGLYCVGCEEFKKGKDLVGGKCPEHNTLCEDVEEENYFFRLSEYQSQLKNLIEKDELKIVPETRKNEVLSFINQGLEDFSISRSVERAQGWGIPVPGDNTQIMYVWFDALTNYLTGLGYAEAGKLFKKFWLDNPNRVHMIGKGILRFHAIYWPAMLLSAKLPLPKEIFVHGYLTIEGQKISKSQERALRRKGLGNVVDPFALVEKYGADPLRYYLLAKFSPFEDGDFSKSHFEEVYNSDLANGLGNLVSRVAKLCEGIPISDNLNPKLITDINTASGKLQTLYSKAVENYRFDEALKLIWSEIKIVDQSINSKKPWKLKGRELEKEMQAAVDVIRLLNVKLEPFLPETAEKIKKQFSGKIAPAQPLFPRLG